MNFKHILLFTFIFHFHLLHGQDLILKNNGDELKIKIIEVKPEAFIFQFSDSLNGPLYTIDKAEVFMIRFENGKKELVNGKLKYPVAQNLKKVQDYAFQLSGNKFSQNDKELKNGIIFKIILQSNNRSAIDELLIAKKQFATSNLFAYISIPLAIAGSVCFIGGLSEMSGSYSEFQHSEGLNFALLGEMGLAFSGTSFIYSVAYRRKGNVHLKNAVVLYNRCL